MAADNQKPWWELEGKLCLDGPLDAERERLRSALARAWRSQPAPSETNRSQTTGPPPRPS